MSTDFKDAADRHWKDAGDLHAAQRLPNADQLYGFATECALKAVMKGLGMPLRNDGSPSTFSHRKHINDLWNEFVSFANGRNGSKYTSMLPSGNNPFSNWNASQRYDNGAYATPPIVTVHKSAAEVAQGVLAEARIDGVVG